MVYEIIIDSVTGREQPALLGPVFGLKLWTTWTQVPFTLVRLGSLLGALCLRRHSVCAQHTGPDPSSEAEEHVPPS